jgi:hypothetical protein
MRAENPFIKTRPRLPPSGLGAPPRRGSTWRTQAQPEGSSPRAPTGASLLPPHLSAPHDPGPRASIPPMVVCMSKGSYFTPKVESQQMSKPVRPTIDERLAMRRCGQLAKENDAKEPNVLGVGSLNLGDASMCAFPARVRRRGAAVEGPRTLNTRPRAQVPAGKVRCRQQSVDADARAAARHRRGLRAAGARRAAARQQPHPAPRHRALLLTSVPCLASPVREWIGRGGGVHPKAQLDGG